MHTQEQLLSLRELAQEKARKGYDWLLENENKSLAYIDVDTLDMGDDLYCVLGQSHTSDFSNHLDEIQEALLLDDGETDEWAFEHGFDVPLTGSIVPGNLKEEYYRELTQAWVSLLSR